MRAIVQRVRHARVTVDGEVAGEIGAGLCVLLSVGPSDTEAVADHLAQRIGRLRILPDERGRMNLDLERTGGSILVVSQFTLHAETSRGHRPSFIRAAPPELARGLCERFSTALHAMGIPVATGRFGAHMAVEIVNDGPVTLAVTSGEGAWEADAG